MMRREYPDLSKEALMSDTVQAIQKFVEYTRLLKGDEKGEAQVFCDRLFQAFGHGGVKEAGAELESRQRRKDKNTCFIDLIWKPRLLLEMKKRGEKLQKHYTQAFEYWMGAVPHRPRYVILCNFDELWIYDFDSQLYDPVDRLRIEELPTRYTALNFMFPVEKQPLFGNNRVDVTRAAAAKVATVFNSLINRGEDRIRAQRFILQCVVAMFAEDTSLLPNGFFSEILNHCHGGQSTYDLIGGLFQQMNNPEPARGGRFQNIRYFNGGIFATVDPIDLSPHEIALLRDAASENWNKVQPPIFGTLFQGSMGKDERHAYGAHFTSEADIQKVVLPTIVRPWKNRIEAATTLTECKTLLDELRKYQVLDPACGSGNFLYVGYRELVRLELALMAKIHTNFSRREWEKIGLRTHVSTKQFHGIEKSSFGVELAKVTIMLAKELALDEAKHWIDDAQQQLPFELDAALPLENLDKNIICDDALFCKWPKVQAIIGNPPYQSKNKAQKELGAAYMNKVRRAYPEVPGRADYCVYWIRRSHDQLQPGGRAGLVGTNTIRQNYSRVGGLDYVVKNNGTITEAVSTQVWPGDAVLHVSIVNWIKGKESGKKALFTQVGEKIDSPWRKVELNRINAALSEGTDVTQAIPLIANKTSDLCKQGQTHGHDGFLINPATAKQFITKRKENQEVLHPYIIGDDLLSFPPQPSRYVIDFHPRDILEASKFKELIAHIQEAGVLKDREKAAAEEKKRNAELRASDPQARINRHHENFLKKWWLLSYPRAELISILQTIPRYAACVCLTKRPIFEFIDSEIHPNAALMVFASPDDYSFGIVQSDTHWKWFIARCSTLKADPRYTSDTVFDTFPWPQNPSTKQIKDIVIASQELRKIRSNAMKVNSLGLRELYRTLELPGTNPLKDAHQKLDAAVRAAYGMKAKDETLEFLLELNLELAGKEAKGQKIIGPGLPPSVKDPKPYISDDCIRYSGP
jgi:hypothetical protein